jgi:hypothetical protein
MQTLFPSVNSVVNLSDLTPPRSPYAPTTILDAGDHSPKGLPSQKRIR